jgi:hypothetical protein
MFSMDMVSGECGGHVVGLRGELDLVDAAAVAATLEAAAARAPQRLIRRVLAITWKVDGFEIHASVAEAAASAGAARQVIVPIRLPGGSWVQRCRPPAGGGDSRAGRPVRG